MSVQCRKAYVSVNLDVDQEGVFHPRGGRVITRSSQRITNTYF